MFKTALAAGVAAMAATPAAAAIERVRYCGVPGTYSWAYSVNPGAVRFDSREGLAISTEFKVTFDEPVKPEEVCDWRGGAAAPETIDVALNFDWDFFADDIAGPYAAEIGVATAFTDDAGAHDGITLDDLPTADEQVSRAGTERDRTASASDGTVISVGGAFTQTVLSGGDNATLYQLLTVSASVAPGEEFEVILWDWRWVDMPDPPVYVPAPATLALLPGALALGGLLRARRRG